MAKFLSKDNFEYIGSVCKQYLKDTQNITVSDQVFSGTLATVMKKIAQERPNGSIEDLNKRTMVAMRTAMTQHQSQAAIPSPPLSPRPSESDFPKMEQVETTDNSEDPFFKKLQQLELSRRLTVTTNESKAPAPAITAPAAPVDGAPAPPALPPTTIVVPSETALKNRGVLIAVNSWDRLWLYQTQRTPFIPSVSIPSQVDTSSAKLLQVMVPHVGTQYPYYELNIEGAGKQHVTVVLVVDKQDKKWITLRPVSETLKPWKLLSAPWTITLRDCFQNNLSLGHDGWVIQRKILKQNGNAVYGLSHASDGANHMEAFDIGDNIVISDDSETKSHHQVVYTTHDTVEIRGDGPDTGFVMNMNRQISVFIEVNQSNNEKN
jgi:hypothetical protein